MTESNQYRKVVPFIIFVLALLLLFYLFKPMITVLLSSLLLAYLSSPLYRWMAKKIPHKSLSIILSLLIVVIIIAIPFTFLILEITQQGYSFYNSLSNNIAKGAIFGYGCTSTESRVCSLVNQAEKLSLEKLSIFGFDKQLQKLLPFIEEKITSFILSIPIILAKIFLTLIIAYFIIRGGENMLKKIVDVLPMRKKTITRLIEKFKDIAHTVIYAQLFVALIQGLIGAVGFYLFGVPFPIFLGVVMAFCSLIPTIGTAIIWAPVSLIIMIIGYLTNNYWLLAKGIGLFLYGALLISTIDNILLARIVYKKVKVNSILVFIGVIGGATMFGFIGIFIGPILLPLLITYFEIFKEGFN
ncbi:MAG: AI-2E family transporter [Nanoarchaeota archaeon]|nr:AI-2E family transporter [Nanoarchaeota archaeon]